MRELIRPTKLLASTYAHDIEAITAIKPSINLQDKNCVIFVIHAIDASMIPDSASTVRESITPSPV
jgi:hypothetical protein